MPAEDGGIELARGRIGRDREVVAQAAVQLVVLLHRPLALALPRVEAHQPDVGRLVRRIVGHDLPPERLGLVVGPGLLVQPGQLRAQPRRQRAQSLGGQDHPVGVAIVRQQRAAVPRQGGGVFIGGAPTERGRGGPLEVADIDRGGLDRGQGDHPTPHDQQVGVAERAAREVAGLAEGGG